MSAFTVRLPEGFRSEAESYAARIGVPVSSLIAIALREYLDARGGPSEAVQAQQGGPAASVPRVAAGQPCPCGSRKPYGKCHGKAGGVV